MNITQIASTLDWRGNNKGVWKALVKDMTPNSSVTFANGYTATVSGRTVSVTNTVAPVGAMTYDSELTNAVNTAPLYGAGTAYDSVEAVAGDKTVRMGSVDLGTLTWKTGSTQGYFYCDTLTDIKSGVCGIVVSSKLEALTINWASSDFNSYPDNSIAKSSGNKILYVKCMSFTNTQAVEFKAYVSGAILYYELAEPTTSTETPQSLSLTTGDDTLSGGSFDTVYEGTDYSIPLIRNCKYIYRDGEGNESLLTGSTTNTSKAVVGGQDKLINLTHWFGRNREPSIANFYALYPTWKNYDIPYDQGSVLNYKGTGVQTIGFNAYNHATGTAALLGGNKYQICGTYTSVSYVDVFGQTETITPDSAGIFTPVNNGVLTVVGGNNTDTCVHLVWSGYKNYGEPEYKWEPFISNVKEFPISTYFPEGMNGIGDTADELTAEQKIVRWGVVDAGTLTWTRQQPNSTYPYGFFTAVPGTRKTGATNVASTRYPTPDPFFTNDGVLFGNASTAGIYLVDSSLLSLSDTELATALTGCLIYYELATPVVTQIDQPLNLAYPVNDFGTEHSLPQNTATLTTTDLKALIKYNTDYMRMNSQLAEIFPTVKSLVKQEQDGYIMKVDDYAPNARVGAADNLIDKNAEGTPAEFTYRTSGGDVDLADGTAIAKKIKGTTLNLNQLVHDTNQNTVTGDGQVEVEDAVVSDVASLVVSGRSLVKNQLVSPTTERTVNSSDGVIAVNDGIVETPKGLVLNAARSVVVNQLVVNGDLSTTPSGWGAWKGTNSVDSNVLTFTISENAVESNNNAFASSPVPDVGIINGHKYLITATVKASRNTTGTSIQLLGTNIRKSYITLSANVAQTISFTGTSNANVTPSYSKCHIGIYYNIVDRTDSYSIGDTMQISNVMLVDITQYFNGDTTLIDSITSWDDLVAYDQRFASYVEYNTGEVAGVQPQVKVTGKNFQPKFTTTQDLNGVKWQPNADGSVTVSGMPTNYSVYSSSMFDIPAGQTIIVSFGSDAVNISFAGMELYDADSNSLGNLSNIAGVNNKIIDLSNYPTARKLRVSYKRKSENIEVSGKLYPQVELGSTATAYEPYHDGGMATSPQELFAVGTAADSFEAVTGKLTHRMASVDLGTMDWGYETTYGIFYCSPSGKKTNNNDISLVCSRYTLFTSNSYGSLPDKMYTGKGGQGKAVFFRDDSYNGDKTAFKTAMSGVYLYYELAAPTEELLTPATLSFQKGNNVALQTDGGMTIPFNLTYDGTLYDIALDSTHKYAFSDNGTKSIITSSSTQAVNGDEDMLVDVTRMFNGDSTAITAITSWNDMAAVMPEYNSTVAYNEGEVVGRTGGVTTARWNQLIREASSDYWKAYDTSRTSIAFSTNTITVTVISTTTGSDWVWGFNLKTRYDVIAGHKYYARFEAKSSNSDLLKVRAEFTDNDFPTTLTAVDTWGTCSYIAIPPASKKRVATVYFSNQNTSATGSTKNYIQIGDTFSVRNAQLFDLTAIYGAGHEPSTVEEFEADCLKWGKDLTQYQAYDAGTPMGGSATFSNLQGVGSVVETQNIITGEKDVKFGSVDMGTLTWATSSSVAENSYTAYLYVDIRTGLSYNPIICGRYLTKATAGQEGIQDKSISTYSSSGLSTGQLIVRDSTYTTASTFKAAMSGVMLYYELATPSTTSETPQPLTFSAGLNNVHEEDVNITSTPINMEYTGTDYTIATKSARKYIKTIYGTTELVTGVSSVDVRGGRDNLIDLTRMFGATLEPGTLADFYQLFPAWNGYKLPYNKGSLLNYKGTGLKRVGFNQFTGEYSVIGKYLTVTGGYYDSTNYSVSEYLRVIPGQVYRFTAQGNAPSLCWYTYDKTFISGTNYGHAGVWQEDSFTAPANAYWVRLSVYLPRETEACFYLQWSGTRNGDYEPYWSYTRPVPTLTYFPDGMNGRGSVYDEMNERNYVRRFGKVDLGTLEWNHINGGTYGYWESTGIASSIMRPADHATVAPMVSSLYVATSSNNVSLGTDASLDCIGVRATSGNIRVNNGSATESPTGWLVYELATPVTTTYDEAPNLTAQISDYGTEESLPANGYVPTTAPFRGVVLYAADYARTITKLPENYISKESFEAFLTMVGPLLNGEVTMTYNQSTGQYTFNYTAN